MGLKNIGPPTAKKITIFFFKFQFLSKNTYLLLIANEFSLLSQNTINAVINC